MTGPAVRPAIVRTPVELRPDPGRVITRLFLPGQELLARGESRAAPVIDRVLAMTDAEVDVALGDVMTAFSRRHRRLADTLLSHFDLVAHRVNDAAAVSAARRLLIGAYFTNEFAVEAAALFNPAMVLHPDQTGMAAGEARFVMSLRAVGEGHLSCIEFRTGMVGPGSTVRLDDPSEVLMTGARRPPVYDRGVFHGRLAELPGGHENAGFVLDALPEQFTPADLERALVALDDQLVTRSLAGQTIDRLRWLANSNYDVEFPCDSEIGERVLWPLGPTETHGMEDARFVRFTEDDGRVTYYATYTAFDGLAVEPQLIETDDFRCFRVTQLTGPAARNKGMALFPRRVGGRYVALSRWDRESNAIVSSTDCRSWGEATTLQSPHEPWELLQIGNCGSPIETPEGWLVLTHGVGPMRVYSIGAILLDLDDPTRMIGRMRDPLLQPDESERDGYVPNVVYSCGALLHEGQLVLPYGVSDSAVRIAVVAVDEILDRLVAAP